MAAESPATKVVGLHEHIVPGGMMRMRQVPRIALPAGKPVELKPGGYHVMLIGLTHPLVPGAKVDITLVNDDGSRASVTAPVHKIGKMMMGGH